MSEVPGHNQLLDMMDSVKPDSDEVKREKEQAKERERTEKYIAETFEKLELDKIERGVGIQTKYRGVSSRSRDSEYPQTEYFESDGAQLEIQGVHQKATDTATYGRFAEKDAYKIYGRMKGAEGKTSKGFVIYEFQPGSDRSGRKAEYVRGFGDGAGENFDLHDPKNAAQKAEFMDMLGAIEKDVVERVEGRHKELTEALPSQEQALAELQESETFSEAENKLYRMLDIQFRDVDLEDVDNFGTEQELEGLKDQIKEPGYSTLIKDIVKKASEAGYDVATDAGFDQAIALYKKAKVYKDKLKELQRVVEASKEKIQKYEAAGLIAEKSDEKPEAVLA